MRTYIEHELWHLADIHLHGFIVIFSGSISLILYIFKRNCMHHELDGNRNHEFEEKKEERKTFTFLAIKSTNTSKQLHGNHKTKITSKPISKTKTQKQKCTRENVWEILLLAIFSFFLSFFSLMNVWM